MKINRALSFNHLIIAFFVSSIVLLLDFLPFVDIAQRRILDLHFQIRGYEFPNSDIAIIDIDDESVLKMGSWPWPRSHHADLLKILSAREPSVIFYDVIFSEASNLAEDQVLAEEIKRARNVILPFYFSGDRPELFNERDAVFPIPMFRENVLGVGYVNLISDRDGHVRQMLPDHLGFEHASLIMTNKHRPISKQILNRDSALIWINFPGPYPLFKRISFIDLVEQYENPSVQSFLNSLRNKIVLVGFAATGTSMDLKPTVYSPLYPGVGVQASMVHTLLSDRLIHRLNPFYYWLLLFLFSLLTLRLSINRNPVKALLYTFAGLILFFEITQIAFQYRHLWIPFFGFLLSAVFLYIMITFTQLLKMRIKQQLFLRELALAAAIQKNMLPTNIPQIPGLEIAALSLAAKQVGGDFYDVIILNESKCGVLIGDVSGKGIPAALFMAKAISEFRRESDLSLPAQLFQRLNTKFVIEHFSGLFLTLLYGVIDMKEKTITFSNAGHEPLFFYQKKTGTVELTETPKGIPLGVDVNSRFDQKKESINTGDILLLVSDGLREAMNKKKELFGTERIKSALLESVDLSSRLIVDHLENRVRNFVKGASQHDDLTIVCVKFHS